MAMTKLLYHLTIPPPKMAGTEAVTQEIDALHREFGRGLIYLGPPDHPIFRLPRLLYGFHHLWKIRRMEEEITLHHIYNPDPYPFPVLKWLRKPIIYTLVSGLAAEGAISCSFFRQTIHTVVVSNERNLVQLKSAGLHNVHLIPPGIDTTRFTYTSPPSLKDGLILLAGSAPWTVGQFRLKGIDLLLEAARRRPDLRLVFLWRGVLWKEMARRVQQSGVAPRVEVLNYRVDVNRILSRVHAGVCLVEDPAVLKAYPNSLLEAVVAGRPILVNARLPIADYVAAKGCGVVIERMDVEGLLAGLDELARDYPRWQANTGAADFPLERLVAAYSTLYQELEGYSTPNRVGP
jgi:glycosyltransferase involved in cell wall biosynthesis